MMAKNYYCAECGNILHEKDSIFVDWKNDMFCSYLCLQMNNFQRIYYTLQDALNALKPEIRCYACGKDLRNETFLYTNNEKHIFCSLDCLGSYSAEGEFANWKEYENESRQSR